MFKMVRVLCFLLWQIRYPSAKRMRETILRLTPSAIATFLDFGFPEKKKYGSRILDEK